MCDDDRLLDRPIIIIGAARSGTSILGQVLSEHPALAYAEEPRLVWRYGNDRLSDRLEPKHARPEVRRYIRATLAQLVRQQGRSRLLEKTPANSLRLPFINCIFPNARFVHMIRHGLDAALSARSQWTRFGTSFRPDMVRQRLKELNWRRLPHYAKESLSRLLPRSLGRMTGPALWGPRIPGLAQLVGELDLLEVCAIQWRMCVELTCAEARGLPPDRYMECRLEDLSPQTFAQILKFCELEDTPEVRSAFDRQYDPDRVASWQARSESPELDAIRKWIEPTLKWLGYT